MKVRHGLVVALATFLAFQTGSASAINIRSADIVDGEVKSVDIGTDAVTTDKIAAGAVDDSKIAGPISASKISSAGLDADTVDGKHAADLAPASHTHGQEDVEGLAATLAGKSDINHDHDTVYQKKYANVVVVAKSGGDFTEPVSAMDSITDASAANPYLVKIMPGVYDINDLTVTGKDYVDIEGSGTRVTEIRSIFGGSKPPTLRYDSSVTHASLRDITISGYNDYDLTQGTTAIGIDGAPIFANVDVVVGPAGGMVGVSLGPNSNPKFDHLTVALGSCPIGWGCFGAGIAFAEGAMATLQDVAIDAGGGSGTKSAISAGNSGSAVISDSQLLSNNYGVAASGAFDVKFHHSRIAAGTAVSGTGMTFSAAGSQLVGIREAGPVYHLINCYDQEFNPVP